MPFEFDEARDHAWRARLHTRLRELADDSRVELVAGFVGGVPQPNIVAPDYPLLPGDVAIRWFAERGRTNGELHWLAIEPDAGDGVSSTWFVEGSHERALVRELHHFEDHPEGGDGVMVLGHASGALVLHESKTGGLLPLALAFEDYIELQINLLGLDGVLWAFAALDDRPAGSASEALAARLRPDQAKRAAATLATARSLFGDRDLGLLERRVAALHG